MPNTYNNSALINNGLEAYWKLDEASGTRQDSINGNHLAENTGAVAATAGILANGCLFTPNNNNLLKVASNSFLKGGYKDFTVGGWVYFNSLINGQAFISKSSQNSLDYELGTVNVNGHYFLYFTLGGVGGLQIDFQSTLILQLSQWYYVIVWFDFSNNTLNIQINNTTVQVSGYLTTLPIFTDDILYVGGSSYTAPAAFDGKLDELFKIDRVLTATERSVVYNNGLGNRFDSLNIQFSSQHHALTSVVLGSTPTCSATVQGNFIPSLGLVTEPSIVLKNNAVLNVSLRLDSRAGFNSDHDGPFPIDKNIHKLAKAKR